MNIWWIVLLAMTVVLVSILVFRLHAFLTLLLAGLLVSLLTTGPMVQSYTAVEVDRGKMSQSTADQLIDSSPPKRLAQAFGEMAGKIGILIALASVIGQCLLESGAATTIVDRMLKLTGARRAPEALAASSFLIGIPVFFDTVFYLMIPLARSLRRRVGSDYTLFVLAIVAGGSIAHSLVPPTPGPLTVAGELDIDIATMLIAGLTIGACSSVVSLMAARVINRFVDVPLRDEDQPTESTTPLPAVDREQPTAAPPLLPSVLPIIVPVVLISVAAVIQYLISGGVLQATSLTRLFLLVGEKNMAIATGAIFALGLLRYCPRGTRGTLVNRSLAAAGSIILITSAGGAFGAMLRQAGIAVLVADLAEGFPSMMLLPIAFAVTATIRTLQGSATVAMITAAGVLQGFATAEGLPFHPVYIAMAIGAGSKPISWMTDSGFWIMTRMSGMTESEGLRTISPMTTAMGFSALGFTMLFAWIYPAI